MNLIDAIKSGRPFRRPGYTWSTAQDEFEFGVGSWTNFRPCDIVADDWEIQELTVTITRTQFWAAYRNACSLLCDEADYGYRCALAIARRLGLEDET